MGYLGIEFFFTTGFVLWWFNRAIRVFRDMFPLRGWFYYGLGFDAFKGKSPSGE